MVDGVGAMKLTTTKNPAPMKTQTATRLIRPVDRVTDNRQHWRLKLSTARRNKTTNLTEPDTDARFVK